MRPVSDHTESWPGTTGQGPRWTTAWVRGTCTAISDEQGPFEFVPTHSRAGMSTFFDEEAPGDAVIAFSSLHGHAGFIALKCLPAFASLRKN